MDFSLAKVALDDINLKNHSFRITTTRDKPSLHESIGNVGLLVPPALQRQASGWIIVSGFRRIKACRQAGHKTVTARRIPDDLPLLDCFRLAAIENISQRPLNLIETARVIRQLRRLCQSTQTFIDELVRLGLPASRAMIAKFDRLMGLGKDLQDAVLDGVIGLNVALSIGAMPIDDQNAAHELLTRIPMSVSKQREVLALALDIAGRDRKTLAEVVQSARIREILDDAEMDRNTKAATIRRHFKKTRYPHLSHAEARFHEALSRLKLGPQMRIDPPAGFEGLTYTLTLRFKSRRDLDQAYQKLGAAIKNPAISSLFPD